jgi:hypothetical protein
MRGTNLSVHTAVGSMGESNFTLFIAPGVTNMNRVEMMCARASWCIQSHLIPFCLARVYRNHSSEVLSETMRGKSKNCVRFVSDLCISA